MTMLAARARQDTINLLNHAPHPTVILKAIDEGRIDGSQYSYTHRGQWYGCAIGLLARANNDYTTSLTARVGSATGQWPVYIEAWLRGERPGRRKSETLTQFRSWVVEWQQTHPEAEEEPIAPEAAKVIDRLLEQTKLAVGAAVGVLLALVTFWR